LKGGKSESMLNKQEETMTAAADTQFDNANFDSLLQSKQDEIIHESLKVSCFS